MIQLDQSTHEYHKRILASIYGIAFFGVPENGMKVNALVPMLGANPHLDLLASLSPQTSLTLDKQKRQFHRVLGKGYPSELLSFYEILASPTAIQVHRRNHNDSSLGTNESQVRGGKWIMAGPPSVLVTSNSATSCDRVWEDGPEHVYHIQATHSDLVKFRRYDSDYYEVRERFIGICRRARQTVKLAEESRRKCTLLGSWNDVTSNS